MRKKDYIVFAINFIVVSNVVMICFLIAIVYYANWYLNPAIEFRNVPFPVDKQVYYPGETVKVFSAVCRYTDTPSIIFPEIRNGVIVPLVPTERTGGRVGCYEIWTPIATIPDNYPPDKGVSVWGKTQINLNSFSSRITTWHTETFEVRAK